MVPWVKCEAEGAVAVGGDLSFGGYYVMQRTVSFVAPGDDTPTALLVRGQVDLASSSETLQVLDGMYAKVGDPTGVDVRSTDENGATASTRIQPESTAYGTTPNVSLSVSQSEDSVTTPVPTSSCATVTTAVRSPATRSQRPARLCASA